MRACLRYLSRGEPLPDPLLFNVPQGSSRVVGRRPEVLSLWQSFLRGHRFQLVTGPEGVGKSTLVVEYCNCLKSSGRFSCIQWFDGTLFPKEQLQSFLQKMKGRAEKEVAIIVDDAPSVSDFLALLPDSDRIHIIMTSDSNDVVPISEKRKPYELQLLPVTNETAAELLEEHSDIGELFSNLPGLITVAKKLTSCGALQKKDIVEVVQKCTTNGQFSISLAHDALSEVGVRYVERMYPAVDVRARLAVLASFHISNLNCAIVEAAACTDIIDAAVRAGLVEPTWEGETFIMLEAVARYLRTAASREKACDALLALWPRRMRGNGGSICQELVQHTLALVRGGGPSPPSLFENADRAATFLAMQEGTDLPMAAFLWEWALGGSTSSMRDRIRMAKDCGKVLYCLREHGRAKAVLLRGLAWADAEHGAGSLEYAHLLTAAAPYLDATDAVLGQLDHSVQALVSRLSPSEVVLGKEERRMLEESVMVLSLCKAQTLTDMDRPVPQSLLSDIKFWEERVSPPKK